MKQIPPHQPLINSLRLSRGFTMVELLIVIGITGILMSILSQVFGSILTLKLRSEATSSLAQDGRFLLARLAYDISRASSITLPAAGESGSSLSLLIGGVTYRYELQGDSLFLSEGGGISEAMTSLGTRVSSANFTHLSSLGGKESVRLSFTLAPVNSNSPGEAAPTARQLTTTVSLK